MLDPHWPSGSYLQSEGPASSLVLTADRLYYIAVLVPEARTLSEVLVEITGSGTVNSVIRLGLYSSDANGRPSARVADFGTVDGTTAPGFIAKTGLSSALTRGVYWLGVVGQGSPATQPTVRALAGFSQYVTLTTVNGSTSRMGYREDTVTAGLPATATPALANGAVAVPWGALKAA